MTGAAGWEAPRPPRRRRRLVALALAAVAALVLAVPLAPGDGGGGRLAVDPDAPSPRPRSRAPVPPRPTPAGGDWRERGDAPLAVPGLHAAVWAGDTLLAWGRGGQAATYRPASGRWRRSADPPLGPRLGPVLVWTGEEAIVWGGQRSDGTWERDGAALDPTRGRWRQLPAAPFGIRDPVAAWSGHELLVWGGVPGPPGERGGLAAGVRGAALEPASGRWRRLPAAPVDGLERAGGAWTGEELLLWGRDRARRPFTLAYHPGRGAWRALPAPPLDRPARAAAVWAAGHGELLLWGRQPAGQGRSPAPPTGAALDPATGRWRLLPPAPGYDTPGSGWGVEGLAAVWTGERMIVVGGYPRSVALAFDPATERWAVLPPRAGVIAPQLAWTASPGGGRHPGELLLWGGYGPYGPTVSLASWRPGGGPWRGG